MSSLIPDRFVLLILAVLAIAWFLPLDMAAAAIAQNVLFVGVFLLFFLHGLRLPRSEVIKAARHWRLQATMMAFIFVAMPIAGWALASLSAGALPPLLLAGVIFTAILPSTVQSAISYSSIAGGNVAASVIAAALSNLAGIIFTPLLAALLLGAAGVGLDGNVVVKIATMLLLPFALGQIAQSFLASWAARQAKLLSLFDKGVILFAVYSSFAAAVGSGKLSAIDGSVMLALALLLSILLAIAFSGALMLGGLLRFDRADRISLLFAGAHKSIATGAPLAAILFGSDAGIIILPAICYHVAQLTLSAPLSSRFARSGAQSQAA